MRNDFLFFDLGTKTLRVFSSRMGLIYNGPSSLAVDDEGDMKAYGSDALDSQITQGTRHLNPILNGTLANHHGLVLLLRHILRDHYKKSFRTRVNTVFSTPTFATNVEQRAMLYSAQALELARIFLIPEYVFILYSMYENEKQFGFEFILETGAGRIDAYILNNGKLIYGKTLKGGFEIIFARLLRVIRSQWGIEIGRKSLFSLLETSDSQSKTLKGRNKVTGELMELKIEPERLKSILKRETLQLIRTVKEVFEKVPPDLSADFLEQGLRLSGGPAQIKWFRELIETEGGFTTKISESPGEDVLNGFRAISKNLDTALLDRYNLLGNYTEVKR